ncbi:MAG: citrate synthase [Anaerolineae bacterium]
MQNESLTFLDNRTGKSYDLPLTDGTIRGMDLRQIKKDENDVGLKSYDAAFLNTASCRSKITFIDGDKGILRYSGYPIEQLAERSTFLETAYLLLHNELPTQAQLGQWEEDVKSKAMLHENIRHFLDAFRYDAHPMGTLVGTVAALSTFYPDAHNVDDPAVVDLHTTRLVAMMPTLAAFAYRHSMGFRYIYPNSDLSYTGNFLSMMFKMQQEEYRPNPVLERALDLLFILHADHEQNCSTSTMRVVGSTSADPYAAVAAAASALFGPLHGGANEAVLRMLNEIGDASKVSDFMQSVKRGDRRLMGFGHRVYKNYDPRASIIKRAAYEVFEVTGRNPLLDIATELETIALNDEYFIERKLYPNVDFYSGIIYQALGLPTSMFTVMFAIPRTVGWLAQWREGLKDAEQRISRPREYYVGPAKRDYVPMAERKVEAKPALPEAGMQEGTLTVTDNRTAKVYEIGIADGSIKAPDLRKIKVNADDFGVMSYDPAFFNTASCRSSITEIDGEKGILRHRGYPIEQLAEKSTFLETAYLLIYGELPTQDQLDAWVYDIKHHTLLHENILQFLDGFRYDADPIGIMIGVISALSTFYKDARDVADPESVELQTRRLIAKMPTIAAFAHRHSTGRPYVYPADDTTYTGDFLRMMFKRMERSYTPDPLLERALDILFILHADHGQSTSATTIRMVGSSRADPFVAMAAAIAALRGPKHGGATSRVLYMLEEIGDPSNVSSFLERVKQNKHRVMGFGHRVYKTHDPRSGLVRKLTHQVVDATGSSKRLDVAMEIERQALQDDYFMEHKLYPNVDFYTGVIYSAIGLPDNMFTVMFAIPRTVGWLAQWRELINDSEQKIARPRQIYDGVMLRDYVPIDERG